MNDTADESGLPATVYRALGEHLHFGVAYGELIQRDGAADDFRFLGADDTFIAGSGLSLAPGTHASAAIPRWRAERTTLLDCLESATRTGAPTQCEVCLRADAPPLRITACRPAGTDRLLLVLDEPKAAQGALQRLTASEARLRNAVESAGIGTWYWDLVRNEAEYSAQACRLAGLRPGETLTRATATSVIHPDDRVAVRQAVAAAVHEGRDFAIDYRVLLETGDTRWVTSRGLARHDGNGRPLTLEGVTWDIDAHKRDELALRESEAQFRNLFATMHEGFVLLEAVPGADGRVYDWRHLDMNPTALAIYGLRREQVVGHTLREVFPTIDETWVGTFTRAALAGRPVRGQNYRSVSGRIYDYSMYAPRAGQVATLFTDVTERQRAEREREQLQAQLVQAQKMEAIGQLTGGIAHDFNNILASVLGYTTLALQRPAVRDDAKLRGYLEEVRMASERAAALVEKLQVFSRTRGDVTPASAAPPRRAIEDGLRLLSAVIPASIEIESSLDDVAAVALGPVDLHQLLMNLFINARDAVLERGEVGRIHVTLREVNVVDGCCSACRAVFSGHFVECAVADSGAGIAPEHINTIFDPFFTTKEIGKGTGLGLSVVHGIVHGAGGHIVIESRPGAGTTVRLLLPPAEGGIDLTGETAQSA